MATSYRSVSVASHPSFGDKCTRDTAYWKKFEFPVTQKEHGAVSNIHFSPVSPYDFAVTSSVKVQVLSGDSSAAPSKVFSRFKESARCGSFRSDGKLLVAGSDDANVRLFDIAGKSMLRVFKGHIRPVHATRFLSSNVHIISGSDDKTARMWDIATEVEAAKFRDHEDYVRCCCPSANSSNVFVTGCYDHHVRMFDTRSGGAVFSVDHGHPVESVLLVPSGGLVLSAGGHVVKVWDALAGGRLLTSFLHHHKTVTCLVLASDNQRLLSAGLDRLVKVYDMATYEVVHTLEYPSPILSLGVAADDSTLAVGMSDGLLSIQRRKTDEPQVERRLNERKVRQKASYRYKLPAQAHERNKGDEVVLHKKKEHLARYDKMLKHFEYSKALDAAMDLRVRTATPEVAVGVLRELIRRAGLRQALAGRDPRQLGYIVKFIQKNISNPKFMSIMLDVANIVLDLYAAELGQSAALEQILSQLRDTINSEVDFMHHLMETLGTMDMLFAAANQGGPIMTNVQNTEKTTDCSISENLSLSSFDLSKEAKSVG